MQTHCSASDAIVPGLEQSGLLVHQGEILVHGPCPPSICGGHVFQDFFVVIQDIVPNLGLCRWVPNRTLRTRNASLPWISMRPSGAMWTIWSQLSRWSPGCSSGGTLGTCRACWTGGPASSHRARFTIDTADQSSRRTHHRLDGFVLRDDAAQIVLWNETHVLFTCRLRQIFDSLNGCRHLVG